MNPSPFYSKKDKLTSYRIKVKKKKFERCTIYQSMDSIKDSEDDSSNLRITIMNNICHGISFAYLVSNYRTCGTSFSLPQVVLVSNDISKTCQI